ncbi:hypothetical protein M3P21_21585 [Ruegeria sp. 2012CJ41-6]|uniref:Helix-turn-helix domain-containing protein n=1 Tax=Ruegeria spongiae TaxID=2942209 RepID=A0ABT0Q899_9RHOB|nr:hypothetical protein [Ruegeria spongiae]MCL6286104.1 hypothetical protein [Ruegeria spongiae]
MARKTPTTTGISTTMPRGIEVSAIDVNASDADLGAALKTMLKNLGEEEVVAFGRSSRATNARQGKPGQQRAFYGVEHAVRNVEYVQGSVKIHTNMVPAKSPETGTKKGTKGIPARGARRGKSFTLAKFVEVTSPTAPAVGSQLERALRVAEARGAAASKALLAGDEMLTTSEIADLIGVTRQAIDKRRKAGQLLGLKGGPKTLKYPEWQILPTGETIDGLIEIIDRVDGDAWTAYRLLAETFPDDEGERVYEKLRRGETSKVLAHIDGVLGSSTT